MKRTYTAPLTESLELDFKSFLDIDSVTGAGDHTVTKNEVYGSESI